MVALALCLTAAPWTAGRAAGATPTGAPPRGAAPADAVPLTGYLAQPTEQLALPGDPASAEITPEGDVYTGWAEYALSIGTPLRPWRQPTRVLPRPGVPRFDARLRRQGIAYDQQVLTVAVAGQPIVELSLTARNLGRRALTARAGLSLQYTRGPQITGFHGISTGEYRYERPAPTTGDGFFFQPGEAFDPGWRYTPAGRDVDRSGLLLVRGPAGETTTPAAGPGSPLSPQLTLHDARRLAGGRAVTWTWQIPLKPPGAGPDVDRALDAVSPAAARARQAAFWRAQERGLTAIHVPEARVDAVYLANVMAILQARYPSPSGWVQAVNRLQYQSYWIRDSAIETVALDQVGLHATAAQNLGFLPHWQQPDGQYISRPGQQDGVGQALWELAQHAALTRNRSYAAAQLPNVGAAVDWIARVSSQDPLGVLGPSSIGDDELLSDSHITGDSVWAAVGLRSAVALARQAGQPALAAAFDRVDRRFEASLDAALTRAVARAGHVPPALDRRGGHDWGNDNVAYPEPILDPRSAAVRATLRWERRHSREGLASYAPELHDYLGFPSFQSELAGGQIPAALQGLYAELAHTTAPGFGWEDGPLPDAGRTSTLNLAPHGTFSGQLVSLLRNLLVRQDGVTVRLAGGVSPAWLVPGDHVSVRDAPTPQGDVSFELRASATGAGATLTWTRGRGSVLGPLVWDLPYWAAHPRRASGRAVGRSIALRGRDGTVSVRWSGRRPDLSLATTIAALNRAYVAHGRRAPIVSAPDW